MLMDRGREAGREILRSFDWEHHRRTRYLTLMALLRENFSLLADRLEAGAHPAPDPGAASAAWAMAVDQAVAELARRADDAARASRAARRCGSARGCRRAARRLRAPDGRSAATVAQVRPDVGGEPPGEHGDVG